MMDRRSAIRALSLTGGASLLGARDALSAGPAARPAPEYAQAVKGTAPVKIRDIRTILTAPNRIRLVVVKVETTEPGLVGWGCATFTQRALVVETAIEKYLKPFLVGRDVDEIEDIWQSTYVSSYWRNGPVLFNAMSGVDIALWDIKGKRAGMPLYQLLGGKVRKGADCYFHASGSSFQRGRGERAGGDAAGLPPRSDPGGDARLRGLRRAQRRGPDRRTRHERGHGRALGRGRSHQSAGHLGVRPVRADVAQAVRAHAHASSGTRSSCCTTCTSA